MTDRQRSTRHSTALVTLALCVGSAAVGSIAGCAELDDPKLRTDGQAVAVSGPWDIPAETIAIGDTMYVDYTGAGPWNGTSSCTGGMTPGAVALRDWLNAHYPQIASIGGYSCRPINGNSGQTSVHATGRALDIMIPTLGGEADNTAGDEIANYLIEHAEEMGIQYIIWDSWTWGAHRQAGSKERAYGGAHPHHDHLHVEISVQASNQGTPWYSGPKGPPQREPCAILPGSGGVVDETGPCFVAYGPSQYWRSVSGAGNEGHLLWTNAFSAANPSNWARWFVHVDETGEYDLEVFTHPDYAVFDAARYTVHYAGGNEQLLHVDQGQGSGWMQIGTFTFERDATQFVDVYDNVPSGSVGSDQHIMADAIRLVRVTDDPAPDPTPEPDPDPDPEAEPDPDPEPDATDPDATDPDGADSSEPDPDGGDTITAPVTSDPADEPTGTSDEGKLGVGPTSPMYEPPIDEPADHDHDHGHGHVDEVSDGRPSAAGGCQTTKPTATPQVPLGVLGAGFGLLGVVLWRRRR